MLRASQCGYPNEKQTSRTPLSTHRCQRIWICPDYRDIIFIVPGRSSKDHDFMTVGRNVVERIIGEKLSGESLADTNAGKNPAAVALGKLGGAKGGAARAAALSPAKRKAIAKKAAKARWG